ncbi:hypothetical protein K503DRAFT_832959 [Rhizopogon vinicolor AM-OR11-026]|uniref:Tetrapyrrole methylase domain-containing protein n=1 Tax=Rhizopogon vinicolor AM-OR11-026 TaxID=1314800 RepID=A0A1B7MPP2_9AGAM|nr:hypothetical protein K503DRAFT_832959 [Rhizopogon vinicolor AM-OR11-026]
MVTYRACCMTYLLNGGPWTVVRETIRVQIAMNRRCHLDRWRLDAAEAFSSGPDCTIIAGTGFGKRLPFTMPSLVKADQVLIVLTPPLKISLSTKVPGTKKCQRYWFQLRFPAPGRLNFVGRKLNLTRIHVQTMVVDSTVIAKQAYGHSIIARSCGYPPHLNIANGARGEIIKIVGGCRKAMCEVMLKDVRAGHHVLGVFYGHPGVFVSPSHRAIAVARQEGYKARMLPGISAEDFMFADLEFDPAYSGCRTCEAT